MYVVATKVDIDGIAYDISVSEDEATDLLAEEVIQHSCYDWARKPAFLECSHSIAPIVSPSNRINNFVHNIKNIPLNRSNF